MEDGPRITIESSVDTPKPRLFSIVSEEGLPSGMFLSGTTYLDFEKNNCLHLTIALKSFHYSDEYIIIEKTSIKQDILPLY